MEPSSIDEGTREKVQPRRYFTDGADPFDHIEWGVRTAQAGDFIQAGVEAPVSWSDTTVGIVAKLYFATVDGVKERSVKQMISRVALKIAKEGVNHGYFTAIYEDQDPGAPGTANCEATIFYHELCYMLVNQMAAFNTPIWLNVGVPNRKQGCSACYLLRVDDSMVDGDHSITKLLETESRIFKMGAGSGVSIANIRGSMETLSTGGLASGGPAYMRSWDSNAGTLKSGGAHRRAACMRIAPVDYPDIIDFIDTKRREDRRMRILAEGGEEINPFTASGEKTIAETTSFQNANNSVALTDDFMTAVQTDSMWRTVSRKTGEPVGDPIRARDLLDDIADAAWSCGDPGVIYIDTVNKMHTTPQLAGVESPISTCNPCGETWLNDDSACNLASLNLMKFIHRDGSFAIDHFRYSIDLMILAMDITCSFSDLPTESIERNTRDLRQLGLGYSNLGALIMASGLPYDSDGGRKLAAAITALLTGRAYRQSAELAKAMGSYFYFAENRDAHLKVVERHEQDILVSTDPIWSAAQVDWIEAMKGGIEHGFRNSQVTVLAPTGTTSYLMGCDTTGVEPAWNLVTYKGLAGAGSMTFVNGSVTKALVELGYDDQTISMAVTALEDPDGGTEAMLNFIRPDHYGVFAGANDISWQGHLKMVAAVQPFVSGAPSKTINMPESATREDIKDAILLGHKTGCKALSIYRDGSKFTQVLTTKKAEEPEEVDNTKSDRMVVEAVAYGKSLRASGRDHSVSVDDVDTRKRLPRERQSVTHKFSIDGHEGYITAGMYEDGRLGEFFLTGVGKEGSFLQGMMGSWSIACSIDMQRDASAFATLARKFVGMEFEPRGATDNPEIAVAKSIPDYIFRWLVLRFGDVDLQEELGVLSAEVKARMTARLDGAADQPEAVRDITRGRPCGSGCGSVMYPTGSCYTCSSCGYNTGCG